MSQTISGSTCRVPLDVSSAASLQRSIAEVRETFGDARIIFHKTNGNYYVEKSPLCLLPDIQIASDSVVQDLETELGGFGKTILRHANRHFLQHGEEHEAESHSQIIGLSALSQDSETQQYPSGCPGTMDTVSCQRDSKTVHEDCPQQHPKFNSIQTALRTSTAVLARCQAQKSIPLLFNPMLSYLTWNYNAANCLVIAANNTLVKYRQYLSLKRQAEGASISFSADVKPAVIEDTIHCLGSFFQEYRGEGIPSARQRLFDSGYPLLLRTIHTAQSIGAYLKAVERSGDARVYDDLVSLLSGVVEALAEERRVETQQECQATIDLQNLVDEAIQRGNEVATRAVRAMSMQQLIRWLDVDELLTTALLKEMETDLKFDIP
ncbi:hypothetical protein AB1K70_03345 [Bremerella sp. JC770]|uniref:hypothetical protein n=1 Tax=Bremerella sp. JC770 TaxID=3232137 RepID=UPI00345AB4A9